MSYALYAQKIRQFLGTWGCQTRKLDDDALLVIAKMAFDVPGKDHVAVAVAIINLGKVERSARIREAIRRHWPEPTRLWPRSAPARKLLKKDVI